LQEYAQDITHRTGKRNQCGPETDLIEEVDLGFGHGYSVVPEVSLSEGLVRATGELVQARGMGPQSRAGSSQ
jgi:hypothetical protein